jgi:hypothetical protein
VDSSSWRFHHQHHSKHAPPVRAWAITQLPISCCWCWSSNHTITYNTAPLASQPALSITATATGKVYGVVQIHPSPTPSLVDPSLAIPSPASPKHAPPAKGVGTWPIPLHQLLLVLVSSNYTITYNTAPPLASQPKR